MKRLFIIAGHGGSDPGAVFENYKESDLAIEFRDLIIKELLKRNIKAETDINTNALGATLNWLKGLVYGRDSILVDIHWNASSDFRSNGTEVIIPDNYSKLEFELSSKILNLISSFGFRKRRLLTEGQTPRKRLGIFRTNCEQVLIEVCFITNANDMLLYQKNKQSIAKSISDILVSYFKKEYVVRPGDNIFKISREQGVDRKKLMEINFLNETSILKIGQILILP